jgi:hypothetical protein
MLNGFEYHSIFGAAAHAPGYSYVVENPNQSILNIEYQTMNLEPQK